MRGKEYLAALKPCGKGMILETLHYADEVRKADPYFREISGAKAEADLLAVAEELIERKTAPFDAEAFKNHYTQALRRLIDQRIKGKAPKVETEEEERPSGDNVIDLMAALKRSLEGGESKGVRKGQSKGESRGGTKRRRPAKSGGTRSAARKPAAKKARNSA